MRFPSLIVLPIIPGLYSGMSITTAFSVSGSISVVLAPVRLSTFLQAKNYGHMMGLIIKPSLMVTKDRVWNDSLQIRTNLIQHTASTTKQMQLTVFKKQANSVLDQFSHTFHIPKERKAYGVTRALFMPMCPCQCLYDLIKVPS